jgi:hypothetical protein
VRIDPKNLSAQLHYRAAGNPPTTMPDTAISNCYPGLEFDFRNIWRRLLVGIELHEADNYVVRAFGKYRHLRGHRLLRVAGHPTVTPITGPVLPGGDSDPLSSADNPGGVTLMEWSNSMARVLKDHAGKVVSCDFSRNREELPVAIPSTPGQILRMRLRVRPLFATSGVTKSPLAVIEEGVVRPGELTQSLCSPWQNDYRECACYYWAASRPDYVNVDLNERGVSTGDNWLARSRASHDYVPDDFVDSRLIGYEDLFREWQQLLRFIIGGRDARPRDGS